MMKVSAVDTNNRNRCCLPNMAKGAALGAAAGLALKYIQPVTEDEKNAPIYKSTVEEIKNRKNVFSRQSREYLADIAAKSKKSVAEDMFVKMFDGVKEGQKLPLGVKKGAKAPVGTLYKTVRILQKENPGEVNEFLNICKDARKMANQTMQKSLDGYNLLTKHFRPTAFFLLTGAVVGAAAGLLADVLRTDVKS